MVNSGKISESSPDPWKSKRLLTFGNGLSAWLHKPLAGGTIQSLAVLPLQNLSGDPKQEYFADGMTEELITTLGQISALRVISLYKSGLLAQRQNAFASSI